MRITANLATHQARKDILPKVIRSLKAQTVPFDEIRIYSNDYQPTIEGVTITTGQDLTDRGKYHFLQPNEIYFAFDDDILYPPFYVEYCLKRLQDYPECILSFHGRRLSSKDADYYHGHKSWHFMSEQDQDYIIDVPGTGLSLFNTNHFMPELLDDDKMVDVLIGLEAARKGVDVVCLAHSVFWFKALSREGIYNELRNDSDRQQELCRIIWDEKY